MIKTYSSQRAKPYDDNNDDLSHAGFARRLSHVRSPWPTLHIGKLLTDKRIAQLQAKGYYAKSIVELRRLQQKEQELKALPKRKRVEAQVKFTKQQLEKIFA